MRVFTDGFFESMSGLTTTGSTILLDIESLPRSVLMWRTVSHWIGGMGLVYMTITLLNNFKYSRFNLINAEVESPEATEFKDEHEARNSGFDFIKTYGLLTLIMIVLMLISGQFFRQQPYEHWYDNAYDSITHSFSTLGTGGFSHYGNIAGLPEVSENGELILDESGHFIMGGLQNPVSEWIITFFMFASGANSGVWYIFFYKKDKKAFWKNTEMKVYIALSFLISGLIALTLWHYNYYSNIEETLRYSFFAVGTVISTTGLENWDFTGWPIIAVTILFIVYFVGGTVGSTGGGLKVKRFIAFFYQH
ncbi:MAG: potassium transporter TrkG [Candidatus Dojkabacteria bacterium]|nr:potassium transporter TrkG [Candidatus Dojkabacteria bacterium]